MTREGAWQAMVKIIDDEMLDTFVPSATYDEIADVLLERFDGLSTMINFPVPDDPDDDLAVAKIIERLRFAD